MTEDLGVGVGVTQNRKAWEEWLLILSPANEREALTANGFSYSHLSELDRRSPMPAKCYSERLECFKLLMKVHLCGKESFPLLQCLLTSLWSVLGTLISTRYLLGASFKLSGLLSERSP